MPGEGECAHRAAEAMPGPREARHRADRQSSRDDNLWGVRPPGPSPGTPSPLSPQRTSARSVPRGRPSPRKVVLSAPGWTNDLEAGPSPGSRWVRPGTAIGYVGVARPRVQVVSLAGARLRSSLRGCPRLAAAGAWGGCACGQRDQSDQAAARQWRGPVKPAITRCPRPGLLTPPSASWWPGRVPGRRASRRRPR